MQTRLLLILFLAPGWMAFAQDADFNTSFEPIRQELTSWDPVRGQWLAESMVAISDQTEIPDRTFPENITPAQMLDVVPNDVSNRIRTLSGERAQQNANDPRWNTINTFVARRSCSPVSGRSYGDPHLESFDGANYSFQTVGEFDLVRSNDGMVLVQTRQKAQNENFSLNTAVAMNVGGDRVGIYAEDVPDGNNSTPVRVNGMAVQITDRPYFLSRGGTIRKSRGMYVIDWPTGESVTAQIRNSSGMSFINVTTNVYPCMHGGYTGLMGNANNISRDDYNTGNDIIPIRTAGTGPNADLAKRQHLAFLAREFADLHRVSMSTSLFDYPLGTSTFTFTDRTFPRVHMTIDDLTPDRRDRARRHCEDNGIRGEQLEGCIFDNAYLNLPPTPRHVVDDPSRGIELTPLRSPIVNTNDNPAPVPGKPTTVFDQPTRTQEETQSGGAQPLIKNDRNNTKVDEVETPERVSTPVSPKAKPVSTPSPVIKPRPSAPKPAPVPKPKPSPSPIKGPGGSMIRGRG